MSSLSPFADISTFKLTTTPSLDNERIRQRAQARALYFALRCMSAYYLFFSFGAVSIIFALYLEAYLWNRSRVVCAWHILRLSLRPAHHTITIVLSEATQKYRIIAVHKALPYFVVLRIVKCNTSPILGALRFNELTLYRDNFTDINDWCVFLLLLRNIQRNDTAIT